MTRVFLTGPMGSGKTTLGRALAERCGVRFIDLDEEVERGADASVSELFSKRGEAGFRELERQTLEQVCAQGGSLVVSLGGGALLDAHVRHALLEVECVVGLSAPVGVLAERVGGGEGRPLLSGDVETRLRSLVAERASVYSEVHGTVRTDLGGLEDQLDAIERVVEREGIVVPLGLRSYDVCVDRGARDQLNARLSSLEPDGVFVVTDKNVAAHWLEDLTGRVDVAGVVTLEPGESAKTLASVQTIWSELIAMGASRASVVLAFGGGVVGDLAGFAASTLYRGVRFVQLPTTTLALSDASVGGKTGFDFAGAKNQIGTIYQPSFVLGDIDWLSTLEARHFRAGLAEVAKAAWLEGGSVLQTVEKLAPSISLGDRGALRDALRAAVAYKARVVVADEREAGARMWLNFGHTLGHAIEAGSNFETVHGEAVAMGMVEALRFSDADDSVVERLQRLLASLELPTQTDAAALARGATSMRADKKRVGANVRFVEVIEPGQPRVENTSLDALIQFAAKKLGSG